MPVTRIDIKSRGPFAGGKPFGDVGSYEQIDGIVHYDVDPNHVANEAITDIKLAPTNSLGKVEFSSDFRLAIPLDLAKSNRRLFLDILNRGKNSAYRNLNSAPDVAPDAPVEAGNGFLMDEGYSIAWCGWQHDVPETPGVMGIRVPEALNANGAISGKIVVTFQPNLASNFQLLSDRNHRSYPANDIYDDEAVMTVQTHEDAPEEIIPREQWAFARVEEETVVPDSQHAYLESGFEPGKVYQVIYTTVGAPVAGLGLLATRDLISFFRYGLESDHNPLASSIDHAYTLGVSQSGRFLRLFLYLGVNYDENGRIAFDGLIPHVAGGKRGEFNQRFAQPSSQASRSTNSLFPFSDVEQTDPKTNITDGLLSRLSAKGELPKIMYTYTPSEYWGGHGSLVHTNLSATKDLDLHENVKIYVYAGSQHALGSFPLTDSDSSDNVRANNPINCLDHRPFLRAALLNLDRWVTDGVEPPPSVYPLISDGTAVIPEKITEMIKEIPGVVLPQPLRHFTRLDFGENPGIPSQIPAGKGDEYPHLVSAIDNDGNEVGGLALPFVSVPLATHTGWNTRHSDMGGQGQTLSTGGASGGTLKGSTIPFPSTKAIRESTGDPRLSIEERYGSKTQYLSLVKEACVNLVTNRYLLERDLESLIKLGGSHYDLFSDTG